MRYLIVLLLCSLAMQLNAQSRNALKEIKTISEAESKGASKRLAHLPEISSLTNNYDLKYDRLEFTLDPAVDSIHGIVTSYFLPITSGFNQIDFDLTNSLQVDSVIFHGAKASYSQTGTDVLEITLASVISAMDSVTIFYKGIPPNDGLGAFTQETHNGTPVIWTLSEPFGAKDWWPCKQDLDDKIDSMDILITTPIAYRAASNGLLISEDQINSTQKTYHWKTRYPIAAYLVGVGVTNYAAYTDYVTMTNGDSVPIVNYIYPENLSTAQAELPDIKNIIKLYDSLLIDYPFKKEKYGHAQFGWGGGMEHQTMSFVEGFDHSLTGHECAHQWFGDKITLGSWQDIWLNEGFATYMEAITEEYLYPANWYAWKSEALSYITSQSGGSVLCTDTTNINRIFDDRLSYNKGAYLLHMLRWQLGDSTFFLSLRNYLNDTALAYNYAKTSDLIYHLEQTSGQDLTQFFNQWYYNQGYPEYHLTWNQVSDTFIVKIDEQQSNSSVSFFKMPLPVELKGSGHDTIIVFNHAYSGQIFTANVNFTVTSVVFDPDLWILSANNIITYNPTITEADSNPISSQLYIYPNPASSEVKIYTTAPVQLKEIDVYDVPGNVISKNQLAPSLLPYTLDISGLSPGVYVLTIQTGTGNVTRQIVRLK